MGVTYVLQYTFVERDEIEYIQPRNKKGPIEINLEVSAVIQSCRRPIWPDWAIQWAQVHMNFVFLFRLTHFMKKKSRRSNIFRRNGSSPNKRWKKKRRLPRPWKKVCMKFQCLQTVPSFTFTSSVKAKFHRQRSTLNSVCALTLLLLFFVVTGKEKWKACKLT